MKVPRQYLLLTAALVWAAAGVNVLRVGLECYPGHVTVLNLALSAAVFLVFQRFIFGPLVVKHTGRILGYGEVRQYIWKFFDLKSFIIMAVMMGGGMILRRGDFAPEGFIAVFYTGLGASLTLAGIRFGIRFVQAVCPAIHTQKKTGDSL